MQCRQVAEAGGGQAPGKKGKAKKGKTKGGKEDKGKKEKGKEEGAEEPAVQSAGKHFTLDLGAEEDRAVACLLAEHELQVMLDSQPKTDPGTNSS